MKLLRGIIIWLVLLALPLQGVAAATMLMQPLPVSPPFMQMDTTQADHHCHEGMADGQTDASAKIGKTDSGRTCHTCSVCCTALAGLPEFMSGIGLIHAHAIYTYPPKQLVQFLTSGPERPPRFVFPA